MLARSGPLFFGPARGKNLREYPADHGFYVRVMKLHAEPLLVESAAERCSEDQCEIGSGPARRQSSGAKRLEPLPPRVCLSAVDPRFVSKTQSDPECPVDAGSRGELHDPEWGLRGNHRPGWNEQVGHRHHNPGSANALQ